MSDHHDVSGSLPSGCSRSAPRSLVGSSPEAMTLTYQVTVADAAGNVTYRATS